MKTLLPVATIFCGFLTTVNSAFAQAWTTTSFTNMEWFCFASSADGNTLVAEPGNLSGVIFVSTNSGTTWSTNALPSFLPFGNLDFVSIASSADGTKLAGVFPGGAICTSTNSGTTWTT